MIEMSLDESLIRQLGVEPTEGSSVEFDAKGTLHIIDRDSEGGLIKDSPIMGEIKHHAESDFNDRMQEYESLKKKSSSMKGRYELTIVGLLLAATIALVIVGVLLSL